MVSWMTTFISSFEIGQTDLADIALSIKKERFNE